MSDLDCRYLPDWNIYFWETFHWNILYNITYPSIPKMYVNIKTMCVDAEQQPDLMKTDNALSWWMSKILVSA